MRIEEHGMVLWRWEALKLLVKSRWGNGYDSALTRAHSILCKLFQLTSIIKSIKVGMNAL